jgi:hypothetical protein
MRSLGKPGMTDQQVADFVDRYMPAYKAYLPGLYAQGPTTAKPGQLLVVEVDRNRAIVEDEARNAPADGANGAHGKKTSTVSQSLPMLVILMCILMGDRMQ